MQRVNGRRHGKFAAVIAVLLMLVMIAGCGAGKEQGGQAATTTLPSGSEQKETADQSKTEAAAAADSWDGSQTASSGTLTVVASPGIHTEILKMAQIVLAGQGIDLVIDSEFDDYMMPNLLVDGGVYDCNYFQHEEYLTTFNAEQGTDLVSVGKIHFEPLGIYRGKKWSLDDLASGDVITIPRDTANQARALKLLSDAQLIGLAQGKEMEASIADIKDNPKGIKIELMDASQIASAVANSAFVVMNGNYARQALYKLTSDAIAYESPASATAERYANIIAVNRQNVDDPRVQALVKVLQSEDVRTFIDTKCGGEVVPYTGS
ncbi:MAG: metal ABC transporter substrate-binding protein [Lachnospiraceae bacterium]|nr:metal ABC transporter substrate-binding protein [Lachnospiraceae bacterium]